MSSEKQLPALVKGGNFQVTCAEEAQKIGDLFATAGLFDITDKEEKAGMTAEKKSAINAVKVIAGASMGLSPFAAMKGLHVIKGKVMPGYQTMLACVRKYGYDFKWHQRDNDVADIEFFGRTGESLGRCKFTTEDMQRAKLGGDNWMKFPRQMRASKAVSEGVNAYCPEVLEGTTYTPEDFDAVADVDEVTEVQTVEKAPAKKPAAKPAAKPAEPSETTTAQSAAPQATQAQGGTDPKPTGTTPSSDTSGTTQSAAAPPATEDITDVTSTAVSTATMDDLGTVLEAGIANGWTQEQVQDWLLEAFAQQGVDTSDESMIAKFIGDAGFEFIEAAAEYVKSNKPE